MQFASPPPLYLLPAAGFLQRSLHRKHTADVATQQELLLSTPETAATDRSPVAIAAVPARRSAASPLSLLRSTLISLITKRQARYPDSPPPWLCAVQPGADAAPGFPFVLPRHFLKSAISIPVDLSQVAPSLSFSLGGAAALFSSLFPRSERSAAAVTVQRCCSDPTPALLLLFASLSSRCCSISPLPSPIPVVSAVTSSPLSLISQPLAATLPPPLHSMSVISLLLPLAARHSFLSFLSSFL